MFIWIIQTGKFSYLKQFDRIHCEYEEGKRYDLCITCDSSDAERLGAFRPYFDTAKHTFCVDHHVTNRGFAEENCVEPDASSASEVVCTLLDMEKIDLAAAECFYTGIVHDTGVFKFSCTSGRTMEIAGKLMDKGIDTTEIIDGSFYRENLCAKSGFRPRPVRERSVHGRQVHFQLCDEERDGVLRGDEQGSGRDY